MSPQNKIRATHLERTAIVYVRQSSPAQVRDNRESQARQYALVEEAARLGWPASKIEVIDAGGVVQPTGFVDLSTESLGLLAGGVQLVLERAPHRSIVAIGGGDPVEFALRTVPRAVIGLAFLRQLKAGGPQPGHLMGVSHD